MAPFNFAYSVPFPASSPITQAQAFEALRIKCRDPARFISGFTSCEVIEETPTFIKRKSVAKSGQVVVEDVELYAPTMVVQKSEHGTFMTNIISESESGGLLLTCTFDIPEPELFSRSGEDPNGAGYTDRIKQAVNGTLKTILELHEKGELN